MPLLGSNRIHGFLPAPTRRSIGPLTGVPTSGGLDLSISSLERIELLHEELKTDPSGARHKIDSHLLAFYIDPVNGSNDLILPLQWTYHYLNLPDLTHFLRRAIAHNAWDDSLVSVLMSPFCLHVKHAVKTRDTTMEYCAMRSAVLNLLHGLLLGLYPYTIRHISFTRRCKVAGEVRRLMCQDEKWKKKFITTHTSLLTLAMSEYLINILSDFCPVEEQLLIRQPNCRFTLNNLCDNFRLSVETTLDQVDIDVMWDSLNTAAAAVLPTLQRQLKLCNYRPSRRIGLVSTRLHTAGVVKSIGQELVNRVLSMQVVPAGTPNLITQIRVLDPAMSFNDMQAVEYVWHTLAIHPLPVVFCTMQLEKIKGLGSCRLLAEASQKIHVCIVCALRRRVCILKQQCSLNCKSRQLECKDCKGPMQSVNLVGRVLQVQRRSYFLCPGCLSPTKWTGNLYDCRCFQKPPILPPPGCFGCSHRNIVAWRQCVDVDKLEMRTVPLCHRHAKACVLSQRTVYDLHMLEKDIHFVSTGNT